MRKLVLALATAALAALALSSAAAGANTYSLSSDIQIPTPAPKQRLPDTTLITLAPQWFIGPRMLTAQVDMRYVVTPDSDHWDHGVALRTRIQCVLLRTGRLFTGPYAAHNFVWDANNPPGPDIVLQTRALISPPEARPATAQRMQCSLVASTGVSPERSPYGHPAIEAVGSAAGSPTFLQLYPASDPASTTWKQPSVSYLRTGSAAILSRDFGAPRRSRWLFFAANLELTSCYYNTGSCPSDESGLRGENGTYVRTQLTARGVPGACAAKAVRYATVPVTTFISNPVHHYDLSAYLWMKLPPGRCVLDVAVAVDVLSGNPLRIETGSQTRAILIPTRRAPCPQPNGRPVPGPQTCAARAH